MMLDTPKHQKLLALENRQYTLQTKLSRLQEHYDLETRVEEQLRLEQLLADTRAALQQVENELLGVRQQDLLAEANRLKRIGSTREAISIWKEIQANDPSNSVATREVTALEKLDGQQLKANMLIKQLSSRFRDINLIFKPVVAVLRQPADKAEYEILLEQTELFIDGLLDADSFIMWWEAVTDTPATIRTQSVDIARIAGRVQRGEMVLFIGSGIASIYSGNDEYENELVGQLAQQIGYGQFRGTLSSIAEYYQLRPDFGQLELLKTLRTHLPQHAREVLLYSAMAKVESPLILISSAYDNLLEDAFRAAGKPFVELASIVRRSDEYDIGHVVVNYSDNRQPNKVYPEEDLSSLRFLEQGYSVIYKIRGTCDQADDQNDVDGMMRQDALTLSESNYFSFARYADRIIPGYLARQFRNRGFLFVGYRPRNWEDRLLVSSLLEKRNNSQEPCYVIGAASEPMEAAFWKSRSVEQYQIDIRELDKYLEEVVA